MIRRMVEDHRLAMRNKTYSENYEWLLGEVLRVTGCHGEKGISEDRLLDVMARFETHGIMAFHYLDAHRWWYDAGKGTRVRMLRVAIRELCEHHRLLPKSARRRDKSTPLIVAPTVLDSLCAVLK